MSNLPFIPYTIFNNNAFTVDSPDLAIQSELAFGAASEKINNSDGCICKKCKTFYEYGEPNQEDGTLVCWACRHGY